MSAKLVETIVESGTATTANRADEFVRRFWIALVGRSLKIVGFVRIQHGTISSTTSHCDEVYAGFWPTAYGHLIYRGRAKSW